MVAEYNRTRARKKILLPSGDVMYVPVIRKISFTDPYDRYQETEHELDNSADSTRKVHVDIVNPVPVDEDGATLTDDPVADTSQDLFVERIDTWNAVDPYERYQETQLSLDNKTGNDLLPPHFSNHEKTHIYRYFADPQNPDENGVWIDSELIDDFAVVDPYDRYQETHYTLDNPTNQQFRDGDLSGQASTDDADITIGTGEGTEDAPVRLDPFQNIVNFSGTGPIIVQWLWVFRQDTFTDDRCGTSNAHYDFGFDNDIFSVACPYIKNVIAEDPNPAPLYGPSSTDRPVDASNFIFTGTPLVTTNVVLPNHKAAPNEAVWTQAIVDGGNPEGYNDTGRTSASKTTALWGLPIVGSGEGIYAPAGSPQDTFLFPFGTGLIANPFTQGAIGEALSASLTVGPTATYSPNTGTDIDYEPYKVVVAISVHQDNSDLEAVDLFSVEASDFAMARSGVTDTGGFTLGFISIRAHFKIKGSEDPPDA